MIDGYDSLAIKRDSGLMGGACKSGVYIDGKNVGSLAPGEMLTVYLPPGTHMTGARGWRSLWGWNE